MVDKRSLGADCQEKEYGTYLGIGSKALDESSLPVDLLEDDQTLPSFAVIIWHLLVVAQEKQSSQIIDGWLDQNRIRLEQPLTRVLRHVT